MSTIDNVSAAQSNILQATLRQQNGQENGVAGASRDNPDAAATQNQNEGVQALTRDAVEETDESQAALRAADEGDEDGEENSGFLSQQSLDNARIAAENGAGGRGNFLNIQL
eukprot:TRINITY_DN38824_c0_g1_i10.p1 TRINITY_DN38824_c0_g1~~TRINITY_DN38824_c0_g1_i10.p1  ORF type:complete len:112 (-),score=16.30 TRINITY_DN38824_c0_g1_i10:164-499(-)